MNELRPSSKSVGSKATTAKLLVKVLNESNADILIEKQLKPLLEGFRFYTGTIEGLELFDVLFKYLRDCKPRVGVLKALYISHHVINTVQAPFIKVFLSEFTPNVLPNSKAGIGEEYFRGILAANYYNFLVTYAHYYQDLQDFMQIDSQTILSAMEDTDYTLMIKLLTYKNIMKYFTTIKDSIEGVLNSMQQKGLVEKILVRMLRDLAPVYNMITGHLQNLMKHIFDLERDMALLLDELYTDIIQITKKLRRFIENVSFDIKAQLPSFEYYILDSEFNQEEERFVFSLKKLNSQDDSEEKLYKIPMKEYQVFNVGKREYKAESEVWNVTRVSPLETKLSLSLSKDSNTSSPIAKKSSILRGLISPRTSAIRKLDFHKSFSSHAINQALSEDNSPDSYSKPLQSARPSYSASGHKPLKGETPPPLSLRDEGTDQANSPVKLESRIWATANSATLDGVSSPKIGKPFSSMFHRKYKASKQISPLLTEGSYVNGQK